MDSSKKASNTVKRMIQAYPSSYYHRLTVAYSDYTGMSKSEIACDALKGFFDKIPAQEKEKFLKLYERTPRQSKNGY